MRPLLGPVLVVFWSRDMEWSGIYHQLNLLCSRCIDVHHNHDSSGTICTQRGGIWAKRWEIVKDFENFFQTTCESNHYRKGSWANFGGLGFHVILIGDEIALGDLAAGLAFCLLREDGDGLGPIFARYVFKDRKIWPFLLGSLVSVCGFGPMWRLDVEWALWVAASWSLACGECHQWVFHCVAQERSDDEWRGRLFSTDFLLMPTVNGCSPLVAS
ncbi:MAG: hypothetical protein Ct9H90mP16_07220 [Candidatus Poseidoniales archaeon]|nr:MAG: hypothetical protein Ct9H90mP16_07220 [Candidatus Poseidoniales archaeon]